MKGIRFKLSYMVLISIILQRYIKSIANTFSFDLLYSDTVWRAEKNKGGVKYVLVTNRNGDNHDIHIN